jgi:hypothetical protein
MDTTLECFRPLLEFENGEFVPVDYNNDGINVSMTDHELFIGYGNNPLDEACPIFDNDYVFLKVNGNPFTVDARFLVSLIGRIVELDEADRALVVSGGPRDELSDCIAVFRTAFGISVVSWNSLFDGTIPKWHNSGFITWNPPEGRINNESFSTQTLFSGQFNGAMVYRLARNILL